jgi:hypothetical protein
MHDAAVSREQSLDNHSALVENIPGAVSRSEVGSALPVQQLSHGVEALIGEPHAAVKNEPPLPPSQGASR